jgi:hypothetical protein
MKIWNWNDSASCEPAEIVAPGDVDELIEIVTSQEKYPSPVRAAGELHSLNPCFTTPGTLVFMHRFTKCELDAKRGTVTVGAGLRMIDIRDRLKPKGYQLDVVPEIGNATAGSVACCGTKDSSLGPTGFGQISSTVVEVKMIDAKGADQTINAPADLYVIRSSYGLLGIVYEVTFKIRPRQKVRYEYRTLPLKRRMKRGKLPTLKEVLGKLPPGVEDTRGFLGFLLPYRGLLVVERRQRDKDQSPARFRDWWNKFWRKMAWSLGARHVWWLPFPMPWLADWINRKATNSYFGSLDYGLPWFFDWVLNWFGPCRSYRDSAMIDFKRSRTSYFEFTFWAFPAEKWDTIIPAYLELCAQFRKRTRFRPALPTEVYFIRKDESALLSFSSKGDIFTLDMVDSLPRTPEDAAYWRWMNREFNDFAVKHGARPLLNQTKELSRANVHGALGKDWQRFVALRARRDPTGRFLNDYFKALL